jgi:uncharacterized Zn finger protein
MNTIYRGDDYEGQITLNSTTIDQLNNLLIEVIDAKKSIVKRISLNEKTGYNSEDITQIDDSTIEFRIHRVDSSDMALGKVNIKVSVCYDDESFTDGIRVESDSEAYAVDTLYIIK